jgi:hypothetical protein
MTRIEEENRALAAIGSTEPSTFNEFLRAYPDCPERGDTGARSELFGLLEWLEHQKLIVIERANRRIESLQLTDAGADRVRGLKDQDRGLFINL